MRILVAYPKSSLGCSLAVGLLSNLNCFDNVEFLKLTTMLEALILRCAGGHVTTMLNDLLVMDVTFNFAELMIIKHSGKLKLSTCGNWLGDTGL